MCPLGWGLEVTWAEAGGVDEQQKQRGQALVTTSREEAKHLAASYLSGFFHSPSGLSWSLGRRASHQPGHRGRV